MINLCKSEANSQRGKSFLLLICLGVALGCTDQNNATKNMSTPATHTSQISTSGIETIEEIQQVVKKTSNVEINNAGDFSLPVINDPNTVIHLSQYRGQFVYLDFWASWCPPCRQQLPDLLQLRNKIRLQLESKDDNNPKFEVIAISLDDTVGIAADFIKDLSLDYPVVIDTSGAIGAHYQVMGMPSGYLIDPKGAVVKDYQGYSSAKMAQLEKDLLTLLSQ